jgi:16S rRNA (cytosine967-C5)-methyltransferase
LTDARRAAWRLLRAVSDGRLFEGAREQAFAGLAERDRRLAQEIAAGVLRGRRTLDQDLKRILGKRWPTTDGDLKDLLRIGAYQLRHLTRVPPYAAVQSTVEAAKPLGRKRAAFVNAVLRRLAGGQGGSASPRAPRFSRGAPPELAATSSHPEWLVRRWLARFGTAATEELLRHYNTRPPLVIQAAGWPRERIERALAEAGIEWREAPGGYGLTVSRSRPQDLPGFGEGAFIVQGPGQARLVAQAAVPNGARVWDCCAAPGGKAVALSARGPVVASDWGLRRLAQLAETARRVGGWAALRIVAADALRPPLAAGSMDVVWLDAPCTATAAMGRHPDARWRVSTRRLDLACRRQAALLDAVAAVVARGGLLVYSTCSLEPEENEAQVEAFLSRNPRFARDRDDLTVWPPQSGSDGGFVAVLKAR